MSDEEYIYTVDDSMDDNHPYDESNSVENNNNHQNNILSNIGSAISDSTGSTFGGSITPLSKSQRAPGRKATIGGNDKQNNAKNFAANKATNMLLNKSGNGDKVPDALKKRHNTMPNNSNNQPKGKTNDENDLKNKLANSGFDNENQQGMNPDSNGLPNQNRAPSNQEKSKTEQTVQKAGEKAGSAALQSAGVPKPIADRVAKIAGEKLLTKKTITLFLISGICMIFIHLILILTVIYMLFMPILKGLEFVDAIADDVSNFFGNVEDFLSSTGHWLTGDGWCSTEEECAKTAEGKFYKKVESLAGQYPSVDMSLVLSSVLYGMNGESMFGTGVDDYCESAENPEECLTNSGYDPDAAAEEEKEGYQDAKGNLSKVARKLNKGKDEFDSYMINDFIPNVYKEAVSTGKTPERILKDIYELAKFFNDYRNVVSSNTSGGVCTYSVNGQDVSNIKVRLRTCSWSPGEATTPIDGTLIDFEKYILGVVYAENSGGSTEALKAQAIAARSFALERPKSMGGSYGINLSQENGQWILDIRNCTADQVYCDPDQGCWSKSSTAGDTVYSGTSSEKAWGKGPLAEDSEIRSAVKATNGMVLIDSSGNIVKSAYTSTEQNSWNNKASNGKKYTEILLEEYPKANSIISNCSAALSGEWSTWKQTDPTWGNTKMGSGGCRVAEVGCLVTSISIQIARSGTQINLPSGVTEFNPGVFVAHNQSMFDGSCNYLGNGAWRNSMAPNFEQVGVVRDICGTRQDKVNKIAEYINQGYYLVIRAKYDPYGQHWVAVIGTQGDEVLITDPGWPATELFSYYGNLGVNSNCLVSYLFRKTD